MKRLWNKYQKEIIVGIITIVVLPLIYLFGANLINGHSSDKTIEPIVQQPIKKDSIIPPAIKDTQPVIVNNGNLSLNQKGGKVEQNYYAAPPKPQQRNLTQADISRLKDEIPKDYAIRVHYTDGDKESERFMWQIVSKINSFGLNTQTMPATMMIVTADDQSTRFKIITNDKAKKIDLYVMKQEQSQ